MQLIEVDEVDGVRAAVTTFTSDASSLTFVLVPVALLAEPAHYDAVREKLRSCDVVLALPTLGWPGLTANLGARAAQRTVEQLSRGRVSG